MFQGLAVLAEFMLSRGYRGVRQATARGTLGDFEERAQADQPI